MAWLVLLAMSCPPPGDAEPVVVRVALNDRQEVEMGPLVAGLARAGGVDLRAPEGSIRLPLAGLGAPLTRALLAETIGEDVSASVEGRELILRVPSGRLAGAARDDWSRRLRGLVDRAGREAKRRENYGMFALRSYRPGDPRRPTICLIHGLNSTSSVFRHMIRPLEEAGYGLVVYDFPYNRDLDESADAFRRDWADARKRWGETRPWAIVSHSMGGLLARSYVEDDRAYAGDVASLILIAPANGGSNLSKVQTLLQVVQGLKAIKRGPAERGDAMAHLGDGLGAAADDLAPGSAFLKALNARRRRPGVPYHLLAGDGGFLSSVARSQVEAGLAPPGRPGLLGGLGRLASASLASQLDEISEGSGDGCVSIASSRLEGVDDHVTLRANHLELIRAPLLYPDPGPVPCLPQVLRWLARDLPAPEHRAGP